MEEVRHFTEGHQNDHAVSVMPEASASPEQHDLEEGNLKFYHQNSNLIFSQKFIQIKHILTNL